LTGSMLPSSTPICSVQQTILLHLFNPTVQPTEFSFTYTATSQLTTFSFANRDDNGFWTFKALQIIVQGG
ncbi:unnamed protein product, partial [Didymodactylos carnosus]